MSLSLHRRAVAVAAAAMLLVSASAGSGAQGPPPMPAPLQELLHRSIFSRVPLRPTEAAAGRVVRLFASGASGPPVFIGAVRDEAGLCVAFLEDPQTGSTTVVAAGQRLEQGTTRLGSVEQVTLEALVLRPDGGGPTRRIEVGQTLTGEARPDLAAAAEPTDTTQPAAGAAAGATDPKEILRQRRLRELQGH